MQTLSQPVVIHASLKSKSTDLKFFQIKERTAEPDER